MRFVQSENRVGVRAEGGGEQVQRAGGGFFLEKLAGRRKHRSRGHGKRCGPCCLASALSVSF